MSIDWITVAAQLVNFLVLVWLLKRFLYRPILDGIDAREAEIKDRMQVAIHAQEDAKAMGATYRNQLAALQSEQASASDLARQKAEEERDQLLAEAHDRIARERAAWQDHLNQEAQAFAAKMQEAAGRALLELTRKAVLDLADEPLEASIAAHLVKKIATMDDDLRRSAGAADHAKVISHDPLPAPIQDDLSSALRQQFPDIAVQFEADDRQSPGVSVHLGGAHLEWTVATYIDGLGARMVAQMATETGGLG